MQVGQCAGTALFGVQLQGWAVYLSSSSETTRRRVTRCAAQYERIADTIV
jgi:hypothetical protein